MTALALLAALLLALAPTLSRIVASAVPEAPAIPTELCTGGGTHAADDGNPHHAPTASTMDDACGYCALLLPPLPQVAALAAWLPPVSRATVPLAASPVLRWPRNLRGLGSQAPPVFP